MGEIILSEFSKKRCAKAMMHYNSFVGKADTGKEIGEFEPYEVIFQTIAELYAFLHDYRINPQDIYDEMETNVNADTYLKYVLDKVGYPDFMLEYIKEINESWNLGIGFNELGKKAIELHILSLVTLTNLFKGSFISENDLTPMYIIGTKSKNMGLVKLYREGNDFTLH